MPFSTQFSLSLELTRLIPLGLDVAGKTYDAAMSLARDLRSSGSDIVIEEDLAELFGRSRIASQMASTFRTIVTRTSAPQKLCEGIVICNGPGPTVIRGLTQEAYFSTILQFSVYEKRSLASAIANYFEKQVEGAPEGGKIRAAPSLEGIRGTLQACEDQTSSFDWRNYLIAVGTVLELTETKMLETIPSFIFRGLVNMLPLVQHFPEDRLIDLRTKYGVCSIVVWAHHILGLSVSVRLNSSAKGATYCFGPSLATIFIESYERSQGPSITLLSTSDKIKLFTMKPEPDEENIDATFKGPTRGYGSRIFDKVAPFEDGREKLIKEMALIATAFAICVSRHLSIEITAGRVKSRANDGTAFSGTAVSSEAIEVLVNEDDITHHLEYNVSERGIHRAAHLLFDDHKPNKMAINDYVMKYADRSLYNLEEPPRSVFAVIKDWPRWQGVWSDLCFTAMQLSMLTLALAHVANLEDCSDFPMCKYDLLNKSELVKNLAKWDGVSSLRICHDVWFATIAFLMIGQTGKTDLQTTSLISERGWSMYMSTFGDSDPSYTDPGFITIKQGVPCRRGVWKHRVIDGPNEAISHPAWSVEKPRHGSVYLHEPRVTYGIPLVGEREDSFVVNLRLEVASTITGFNAVRRTGYNELSSALWRTQKTRGCKHHNADKDKIKIEPGCTAISGFEDQRSISDFGRTVIFLTADNPEARWRTLLALAHDTSNEYYGFTPVMLRGSDCCFPCVVDQTVRRDGPGPWCIVL